MLIGGNFRDVQTCLHLRRVQFLACTACRVVIRSNTLARGGSRVRATRTVPRLQVRPVVSHNEDLLTADTVSTRRFEHASPEHNEGPRKTTHRATTTTRIENPLKAFRPKHSRRLGRLPYINSLNSLRSC